MSETLITIKNEAVNHNGSSEESVNHLFPVFLKLEELHVLLVGAGKVGHEKLTALLDNAPGVPVHVVSETVSNEVKTLAEEYPSVIIDERRFEQTDLEGKDIVLIAINDPDESSAIRDLAKQQRLLVNVADKPEQCDFYLSSIVR